MIEYITRYCKKPEMLWEVAHVFVGVKEIGGVAYLVLECVVVVMTTESPFSSSYVSVRVIFMSLTHDVIMILHANTANVPHKMLVFFIIIVLI